MIEQYTTLLNSLQSRTHRAASRVLPLWVLIFFVFAAAGMLCSCSNNGEFMVKATVDGFGTGNLRLVYTSADAVRSITASVIDGKFVAQGVTREPAVVRIYTSSGNVIGRLFVDGGDAIELQLNATDPTVMKAKGNALTEQLAKFLTANAALLNSGNATAINRIIEQYVEKNPSSMLSGLLMADYYDGRIAPRQTLGIISQIDPEVARASSLTSVRDLLLPLSVDTDSLRMGEIALFGTGDSLRTLRPSDAPVWLYMITNHESRTSDSIDAALMAIGALGRGAVRIVDISADADTALWHRSLRELPENQPGKPERYWSVAPWCVPGIAATAPTTVPWFVVADSAGAVFYRGESVTHARNTLRQTSEKLQ